MLSEAAVCDGFGVASGRPVEIAESVGLGLTADGEQATTTISKTSKAARRICGPYPSSGWRLEAYGGRPAANRAARARIVRRIAC